MATLKTDTQVYQDEKAEYEFKLVDLKRSVNEAASELELATNEHAVYTSAEVKERNRLEDLHSRIASQQQLVQTKAATLAELEETLPAKEEELRTAEAELVEVGGTADRARSKLHNMRAEFDEKRSAQMAGRGSGWSP